jgi:trehalose 6-phosphate synthase
VPSSQILLPSEFVQLLDGFSGHAVKLPRTLKFVMVLVAGLGVLTWAASIVVTDTTQAWFERDLALRADLVAQSGRRALVAFWREGSRTKVRELLDDVTRDERIMAAGVCGEGGKLFSKTADFPDELSCPGLSGYVSLGAIAQPWRGFMEVRGGSVHVSLIPVADGAGSLGFLVLVHDISFVERRAATALRYLVIAFAVLALLASVVTVLAARLSWRGFRNRLRRFLAGEHEQPEFQPLLKDVRELVERLATERDGDGRQGAWSAQRLRRTLERDLQGERVIIVANREPYIHERAADGTIKIVHPASGLVTALEPVMRACSGVWVAHGSGSADRDTADANGRLRVPPGDEAYGLRRVWLTSEEEKGYYYGLANEGLWPLCHMAYTRPTFRHEDWVHYEAVNKKFADVVCSEADVEDPIILVQDYHFALVPRFIREQLPRATILTFWHIPWPNAEQFGVCPWRAELLEGLLGSSIVGFHTQLHCNNFLDAVDRYMEARIDREQTAVVSGGQTTLVRPYPISIEWPNRWANEARPAPECRAEVFRALGIGADALLGVGVDRLDYTKGVEERLLAVERLLELYPALRGRFTFAQLAAPSRMVIERYKQLNDNVEQLASRINARFGQGDYRPVVILRAHHEPPSVFRYYRAADLCYVSSLHDGMNLVAKEFVAARADEAGVLVLSQFTGAARELSEALIVNPHDFDEAATALATALMMPKAQQQERMRAMRALLAEFNVYRWAGRMLADATRLRRGGRLRKRLRAPLHMVEGEAG